MELPEDHGTYVLIARVLQTKRLGIGSLGKFDITPGFYAYVGSAFGSGGLRARLGHHLESLAEPHWHIDYLLEVATPIEIWFIGLPRLTESWRRTGRNCLKRHLVFVFQSLVLARLIITGAGPAICFIPSAGLHFGGSNST